jgi:hypothetical protein
VADEALYEAKGQGRNITAENISDLNPPLDTPANQAVET